MRILEATVNDAGSVALMVAELLTELGGAEVVAAGPLEELAAELLARQNVTGLIAYEGMGPVGLIMLNQCAAIYADGVFGEITELYVLPEYRSRGVAARLITAAEALGHTRGWRRLEVGAPSQPAWQRTLDFYQRSGFLETGPRLRKLL
ncbi:GNAT family N-acetyltransferase [Pseudophaeobacter sp.]|uniref:GNAT family N-acetyltransferase n=1 Tax=Pseudophaeobacter sp. TaxID=1971739 RepID=UPI00405A2B2E